MGGSGKNFETFQPQRAKFIFGKHSGNSRGNDSVGVKIHLFFEGAFPEATGIAGMPAVHFLVGFVASDFNFGGVGDNHVVAAIEVGREVRFMFSYKETGNFCGDAAQDLPIKVYKMPATDNGFLGGDESFWFHVLRFMSLVSRMSRINPFEAGEAGGVAMADTGMNQAGKSGRTGRSGSMFE